MDDSSSSLGGRAWARRAVSTAAVQGSMAGIEIHVDDYVDQDDELYFLEQPFSDNELNIPAIAGKIFLPAVGR